MAGQNLGARHPDRAEHAVAVAARIALAGAAFIGLFFFFMPAQMLGIFGMNDPEVVEIGHAARERFKAETSMAANLRPALALPVFWNGLGAGLNYALSFVIVQLLHWTVATKQPAMTAPSMARKLEGIASDVALGRFVDEVAHLLRSQMAGIIGNLVAVAPVVLALQGLSWWLAGRPLIGQAQADYVLHSTTLLGPTALFAAFTGVLLFASSLIAGWVENWFVFHRLDSAIAWNPRSIAWLGEARAQRWARWWRDNISGLAANVSLGLMLGLVPAVLQFFGLPLEVRHVTLAMGQIAAAAGSLGTDAMHAPGLWWALAGVVVTGALNVGVSFVLALHVAARSRGLALRERAALLRAVWLRLRHSPRDLFWPRG